MKEKETVLQCAIELIAIGCSTGGPEALLQLFSNLPCPLKVPVVIVQHMSGFFTKSLAQGLSLQTKLKIVEGIDNAALEKGVIYIAPGNRQMKIRREAQHLTIAITDDPPEQYCKPSIDYLFRSIAVSCSQSALGIILTGLGSDGTLGAKALKESGCIVFAQDQASCVVFGMPKAAIEAGVVDRVFSLADLKNFLQLHFGDGSRAFK